MYVVENFNYKYKGDDEAYGDKHDCDRSDKEKYIGMNECLHVAIILYLGRRRSRGMVTET